MPIEPFIKCSNLPRSLEFYTGVLDFTVVIPPDPDPAAFMSKYALLERQGSRVHLSQHAGDGAFGSLNYINVNDLDALYRWFVGRGLAVAAPGACPGVVIEPVEQSWGMKEFSLADPDGNRLTFGQSLRD